MGRIDNMSKVKNSQVSVTFVDVLYNILSGWKILLVGAIIGFIAASWYVNKSYDGKYEDYTLKKSEYDRVMGAYLEDCDFVRRYNALSNDEQESAAKKQSVFWRDSLTDEQVAVVDNAIGIKKLMLEVSEYLDSSILMNLDPYNVATLLMRFEVSSDDIDITGIAQKYYDYITSSDCMGNLATCIGIDVSGEKTSLLTELVTAAVAGTNQVTITMQYGNTDELTVLADAWIHLLADYNKELSRTVGTHEIACIENVASVKVNNAITTTRNGIQNQLTTYNTQLNNLKTTMTNTRVEMIRLFNYESDIVDGGTGYTVIEAGKEPNVETPGSMHSRSYYRVVGAVVGIIVALLFLYVCSLFAVTIQKGEELYAMYDLPLIGQIVAKRRIFVDTLISRLRYRKDGCTKPEESLRYVCETIASCTRRYNASSLVIVSTISNERVISEMVKLASSLKEKGVQVIGIGNPVCNADILRFISQADAVVVCEQIERSRYSRVSNEMILIDSIGAKVVGAVVIK